MALETSAANNADTQNADVRIERLVRAVEQTQKQLEASQQELEAVKNEMMQLRAELLSHKAESSGGSARLPASADMSSSATVDQSTAVPDPTEQSVMQSSQIATLDQVKVESESKYPLRLSGTLLLNGFVNTGRVDVAASPSAALGGRGSTGLSVRQTVLGLDADGPRLWGAASHADLRVDFFGSTNGQTYNDVAGLVRLRTAHAALAWQRTRLFFSLDRPLINPNTPESLLAVAQPELAWSGNLWSWNAQVGIAHTVGTRTRVRFEAALMDALDPPPLTLVGNASVSPSLASTAETSRRPASEARIAILGADDDRSAQFGVGGYFAPHFVATSSGGAGANFDAWATTVDYKLPLSHGFVLSGSAYRGQALGGLGGGGYKDYVSRGNGTSFAVRLLDDVGGWAQLHAGINQQVSWNAGLGIDNVFSGQVRSSPPTGAANVYGSIARNRTFFANVIYSPSAYLKLSLEYRNIYTAPAPGPVWTSNTTGVGAAYRF